MLLFFLLYFVRNDENKDDQSILLVKYRTIYVQKTVSS